MNIRATEDRARSLGDVNARLSNADLERPVLGD